MILMRGGRNPTRVWGKSIPGRGNSQCKGSEQHPIGRPARRPGRLRVSGAEAARRKIWRGGSWGFVIWLSDEKQEEGSSLSWGVLGRDLHMLKYTTDTTFPCSATSKVPETVTPKQQRAHAQHLRLRFESHPPQRNQVSLEKSLILGRGQEIEGMSLEHLSMPGRQEVPQINNKDKHHEDGGLSKGHGSEVNHSPRAESETL